MLRTNAIVRTVWAQDLVTETKNGTNGPYESKSILFRVATDRNYKVTTMVNGQPVTDNPTDFILCRATGSVAQAFSDHCTSRDKEGKLQSRHLALIGHIETYQSPRKVPLNTQVNIGGLLYNISAETEIKVDGHIFVVEEFEFLDSKPREVSTIPGATVSSVNVSPVATPAQAPVSAAPVQPAQAPVNVAPAQTVQPAQVQAPVYAQAPVMAGAVVAQNVTADPLAGNMNAPIPTVDTNFNVAGQTAPF